MKTKLQKYKEIVDVSNKEMAACTIELAEAYLQDYPRNGRVWLELGIALSNLARYKKATQAIQKAIEYLDTEDHCFCYLYFGHLYKQKGNYKKAIEWYRKASDADPDSATYFIYLGGILATVGKLTEAEECHRYATKCKEGAIDEAYLNLGYVLRAQERYDEALLCFEKAIELDPKYKVAKAALKDMKKLFEIRGLD